MNQNQYSYSNQAMNWIFKKVNNFSSPCSKPERTPSPKRLRKVFPEFASLRRVVRGESNKGTKCHLWWSRLSILRKYGWLLLLTTIMCQESLLWTYDTSNVEQLWYCFGFSFVIAISRSPADILNFFTSTTKRNWKEIRLILCITKSSHVTLTMWLRVIFAICVVAHVDGQRWC